MQHRRTLLPLLILSIGALACTILNPQTVIVPTPIPTAPSLEESLAGSGEIIVDPVSNIVPNVDPDIETLVNAVSQQQLMAYVQKLESFGTRNAFSDSGRDDYGVGGARRWIFNEFVRVGQASNGRLQVRFEDFPLNYNGFSANQQNVVAILPGTAPDSQNSAIVLVAHYDTRSGDVTDGESRAPGANDNGSGVALLLESARLLSPRRWNQTIVFLAVAAEEQGTFGSRHYVQNAILNDLDIIATINYDTVGGRAGIPQSIRLFAPDLYRSPSGQLGRYYDFVAGLYVPTFPITVIDALDREGRWGDQREFVYAGLPAVRLTESVEDENLLNSTRDTWSAIDYAYLQKVTQLNVAVIATMAGAPPPMPPPTIVNMANPGSYLLTWPVDPLAAGYAIAFRPLGSEGYPSFRFVNAEEAGNVALTGLDPSQTYAVSMAAIDANGRLGIFSSEVIINLE